MVMFRAAMAPLLVLLALGMEHPQLWLGSIIAVASISDLFDGILARRWGTATSRLRIADSVADLLFYVCVLAAIVARHWPVVRDRIVWVAALLLFEALRMLFDFVKYRRMASYHSYASKLWGFLLAMTAIALLGFDRAFWLVTLALAWGILCNVEGLTMSVLLPEWTHDIKSLRSAFAVRRQMLAHGRTETIAK